MASIEAAPKRVASPWRRYTPDLIPSYPDDNDYDEFAEDNNGEVDKRIY